MNATNIRIIVLVYHWHNMLSYLCYLCATSIANYFKDIFR